MVQLKRLWTNTLCFLSISGILLDQVNGIQQKAFYLPFEITNRVFSAALGNPASAEYKAMFQEVSNLLAGIYGCSDSTVCPTNSFYGGVASITFSSGSVIAGTTLVFNSVSINPVIVYYLFVDNASNVQPQILKLNTSYTTLTRVQQVPVPTTTTTTTPTTTTTKKPTTTSTTTTTTKKPTTTSTTTTTTKKPTTTTPTTTSTTTTTTSTTTTTRHATNTTTHTNTTTTPKPTTPTALSSKTEMHNATATPNTIRNNTAGPTIAVPTSYITTNITTAATNNSSSEATVFSTTKANHGNHSENYTTNGGGNISEGTAATVNPHNNETHSPSVSNGKPSVHSTSADAIISTSSSSKSNSSSSNGNGSSNNGNSDWVPAWGIALLALAAAILLLLIIIFIMMLVRWFCMKTESGQMDSTPDPYYTEQKHPPETPLPVYSPKPPVTPSTPSAPVMVGDSPKKNRTGFYLVNP